MFIYLFQVWYYQAKMGTALPLPILHFLHKFYVIKTNYASTQKPKNVGWAKVYRAHLVLMVPLILKDTTNILNRFHPEKQFIQHRNKQKRYNCRKK